MNKEASLKQAGRHLGDAVDARGGLRRHAVPAVPPEPRPPAADREAVVGRELKMPVLHLPQLVGLALGLDPGSSASAATSSSPTAVIDWTESVVAEAAAA